jgi:sugar phosphate isomerase/epimerase
MTQDEIIEMARQAGAKQMVSSLTHPKGPVTALKFDLDSDVLEAFAKLVAAKERETCAKVCDEFNFGQAPMMIQRAIRARGEA